MPLKTDLDYGMSLGLHSCDIYVILFGGSIRFYDFTGSRLFLAGCGSKPVRAI